ncbi:capsid protein [Raccoon dog stool-associated smacovirus 5]|nr:capsid protein [Raccoon dog stool-associated smacovirus 5]
MVSASISEIYDLSTTVGQGTVLKIHTPTGNNVKRHLAGFFLQYKRFRYLGAKVTLVPASTLPADPLQLSYEAGEPTIDPRDMVNPILWRHYHGEAMLTDPLAREFPVPYGEPSPGTHEVIGTSVDQQDYTSGAGSINEIYPMCLMDPSFKKAGVQSGFSTFVKPYVYKLVTNQQILSNRNFGSLNGNLEWQSGKHDFTLGGPLSSVIGSPNANDTDLFDNYVGDRNGVVTFTNRLERLGWMDTVTRLWVSTNSSISADSVWPSPSVNDTPATQSGSGGNMTSGNFALQSYLPNISMLYIMMPPAYKSLFYFRLIIKHYFEFSGFRSCMNVQSFGSASITPSMPQLPSAASSASVSKEISEMIANSADGGPDSVVVENGEIVSSADGVL